MDDIMKLPKWAQQLIRNLESDVDEYRKQVADMLGGDSASDTFRLAGIGQDNPLPRGSRIRFKLTEGYLDVGREGNCLVVYAENLLGVRPQAANVVKLYAESFR